MGISPKKLVSLLNQLPIQIYGQTFYQDALSKTEKLIKEIDPKDADILALTLKLNTYLWSQDKHFEKIKDKIHLLKTEDLL